MLKKYRLNRSLYHAHSQWNGMAFLAPSENMAEAVRSRLKHHQVVHSDQEIVVTDIGFVTMAVHTNRAIRMSDALVVPGVDSEGLRGYLVLYERKTPYHSFHSSAVGAFLEAERAQQKAQKILDTFGSKSALNSAVQNTPWYARITEQDFDRSGLCRWGADAFLRRYGLHSFAWKLGLPGLVVRLAGPYGKRLIAANLTRP